MPLHSAGQVQQHLALLLAQIGALDPFWLNHLAVAARAEHEIAHLETKDGPLALCFVQRTQQSECLVRFATERAHCLAFELINRRVRSGEARRECALPAEKRDIQPEVMSTELNHPRLRGRRLAEQGNAIFVAAEDAHRLRPF